jgi:hypothetical protein
MTQSNDPNRLDRIEKLVESNAKAIRALTERDIELSNKLDRLAEQTAQQNTATNEKLGLANIVLRLADRQGDHEDRIDRLEQQ